MISVASFSLAQLALIMQGLDSLPERWTPFQRAARDEWLRRVALLEQAEAEW